MMELHNYQKRAVAHIISHPYCGLFLDMGLGKTVVVLTAIKQLGLHDVLVVAPKRVVETVWAQEAAKWPHLKGLTVELIRGAEKARIEAFKRPADIHVISRDNVKWLVSHFHLPYHTLVLDELSSFKSRRSDRFKAVAGIRRQFTRVIGLTGTPAPNGLMDLWAEMFLIDGGAALGSNFYRFRDGLFRPGDRSRNGTVVYNWKPKDGAADYIKKRMTGCCMSMRAEDYLSLPERIDNDIFVEMPPSVAKAYRKFETERCMSTGDEVITAGNAAILAGKLQQFANGFVYDDNGDPALVHDLKIDTCKELVEDAGGQPVLVVYNFNNDRDRLLEELKEYNPRVLREAADVEDWNSGKISVMLCHPASGGHGLNLQNGGHRIIWLGPTWSLELEEQLNARLHRQGQKEPVIINRIILKGTVDEDIARALRRKDRTQEDILNAVRVRIAEIRANFNSKRI